MSLAKLKGLLSSKSAGADDPPDRKVDYYEALFSRFQSVPGAESINLPPPDQRSQRIIEAIIIRNIFEVLSERKVAGLLSLGRDGQYQARIAGRFSAQAPSAWGALLAAFKKADKAGALCRAIPKR